MLSYLLGAKEVLTVDIHPWLKRRHAVETFEAARRYGGELAKAVGVSRADFAARCDVIARSAEQSGTVDEFFAPTTIRYLPKTDLLKADLPARSVDVVFSSNVLEHIPPDVLEAIHRRAAELAREGGVALHRFNPDDHFKTLSGSSITFLEYSEAAWRRLGGYGLSYHNRLRSAEHADLARRAGWTLSFWADALDHGALRQLESGTARLAERFASMPKEILAAFYSWFVLRNGPSDTTVSNPAHVKWIDDLWTAPSTEPEAQTP